MNISLTRYNQRKQAQRALRAFQSDHRRKQEEGYDLPLWITFFICCFALGMILTATGVL